MVLSQDFCSSGQGPALASEHSSTKLRCLGFGIISPRNRRLLEEQKLLIDPEGSCPELDSVPVIRPTPKSNGLHFASSSLQTQNELTHVQKNLPEDERKTRT